MMLGRPVHFDARRCSSSIPGDRTRHRCRSWFLKQCLPTRHTRRLPSLRRPTIPAYTPPPFAARSQKRGPLVNIYFMLICINRAGVETNLAALFVRRQNGCGGIALVESISFPDLDRAAHRLLSRRGLLFALRSEEHTSELQSLMRISYAVFCLTKKNQQQT